MVLVWIDVDSSRKVMAHVNQGKEEHYWILEDLGDGYYIIKNKKNPNLVLNVEGGNTTLGTNINVHEKNGDKAQKFKFQYRITTQVPDIILQYEYPLHRLVLIYVHIIASFLVILCINPILKG
ncbi:RICIN domain-containing protein [Bacillus mycoides]|uniref:RICIN domain-containing protein n=1 Tax=Bacillus mycoides TaxID=1405 RepID=UPI003D65D582